MHRHMLCSRPMAAQAADLASVLGQKFDGHRRVGPWFSISGRTWKRLDGGRARRPGVRHRRAFDGPPLGGSTNLDDAAMTASRPAPALACRQISVLLLASGDTLPFAWAAQGCPGFTACGLEGVAAISGSVRNDSSRPQPRRALAHGACFPPSPALCSACGAALGGANAVGGHVGCAVHVPLHEFATLGRLPLPVKKRAGVGSSLLDECVDLAEFPPRCLPPGLCPSAARSRRDEPRACDHVVHTDPFCINVGCGRRWSM